MREHALRLAASRMYLMAEDVHAIQSLVPTSGPCRVVDLGAGSGTTALAVLDVREAAKIVTVDIDQQNLDWAEKNIRAYYPDADWRGLLSDAAAAAEKGERHGIDLVLHDASHEREHVYADISAWAKVVAPGTPLWVHDYASPPESWGQIASPGVSLAIADLIAEGVVEEVRTAGLGWIGRFR